MELRMMIGGTKVFPKLSDQNAYNVAIKTEDAMKLSITHI